MGYTHYFGFKQSVDQLSEAVLRDTQAIIAKYAHLLRKEYDVSDAPVVSPERIQFNGIEEDGHETFCITPSCDDFCKTARKPYDAAVCEVLLVLKHHYPDDFSLDSDGFDSEEGLWSGDIDEEWKLALANVQQQFGYTFTN